MFIIWRFLYLQLFFESYCIFVWFYRLIMIIHMLLFFIKNCLFEICRRDFFSQYIPLMGGEFLFFFFYDTIKVPIEVCNRLSITIKDYFLFFQSLNRMIVILLNFIITLAVWISNLVYIISLIMILCEFLTESNW